MTMGGGVRTVDAVKRAVGTSVIFNCSRSFIVEDGVGREEDSLRRDGVIKMGMDCL